MVHKGCWHEKPLSNFGLRDLEVFSGSRQMVQVAMKMSRHTLNKTGFHAWAPQGCFLGLPSNQLAQRPIATKHPRCQRFDKGNYADCAEQGTIDDMCTLAQVKKRIDRR